MKEDLLFWPYYINREGQYYRFITNGVLHADAMHLIFNMVSFYSFGMALENYLFKALFGELSRAMLAILYVTAIIAAVIPDFIKYKNKSFKAGPTEFKMLKFFLENPAKVFSRQQLLDSIWYNSLDVELRTIDVHILRLRRILEDLDPQLATFLQTVRSFGYKFEKGEV
jgi:hypothetical protein